MKTKTEIKAEIETKEKEIKDKLNHLLNDDLAMNTRMDCRRWLLMMIDYELLYPIENHPLDEIDLNDYDHRDIQWIMVHHRYQACQDILGTEFNEYIAEYLRICDLKADKVINYEIQGLKDSI